jgi:hypothetical protein
VLYVVLGQREGWTGSTGRALTLLTRLIDLSRENHDMKGLADAYAMLGCAVYPTIGDTENAIMCLQESIDICERIGDLSHAVRNAVFLGHIYLRQGLVRKAEDCLRATERYAETAQVRGWLEAFVARFRADVHIARQDYATAVEGLVALGPMQGDETAGLYPAATVNLAIGDIVQAADLLDRVQTLGGAQWHMLTTYEKAYGSGARFDAACDLVASQHEDQPLQLRLGPSDVARPHGIMRTPLTEDWTWVDPSGNCECVLTDGTWLGVANGRDLRGKNVTAPRLLLPTPGAPFTVVASAMSAEPDRPHIGGFVLWKDELHYITLIVGGHGEGDIVLAEHRDFKERPVGRGYLAADRITIRLDVHDGEVEALCSVGGDAWLAVGRTAFDAEHAQVGLVAIGSIDRTVYPGIFPDGAAIRFEDIQVWE